jgi:hypothetical protein
MALNYAFIMTPHGEAYDGEPVMEINTAKWALNLHLLEMASKKSGHLLGEKLKLTLKAH